MSGTNPTKTPAQWATIAEVATLYGISRDTVRRMIRRGDLYAERISPRCIRVRIDNHRGEQISGGGAA